MEKKMGMIDIFRRRKGKMKGKLELKDGKLVKTDDQEETDTTQEVPDIQVQKEMNTNVQTQDELDAEYLRALREKEEELARQQMQQTNEGFQPIELSLKNGTVIPVAISVEMFGDFAKKVEYAMTSGDVLLLDNYMINGKEILYMRIV